MKEALVLIISYLLGAIPIGLMVGKARGVDIRKQGSGNIGATNVLRTLGKGPAAVVFAGDTLKGLAAVRLAMALFPNSPILVVMAGLLSIVGHSASVFLRFKGGKGVATSLGVFIGINWMVAIASFSLWVLLVVAFRYVSIASMAAGFSVPILMLFSRPLFGKPTPHVYTIFGLVAALLILLKHKSNIKRLFRGDEPKFGQKAK